MGTNAPRFVERSDFDLHRGGEFRRHRVRAIRERANATTPRLQDSRQDVLKMTGLTGARSRIIEGEPDAMFDAPHAAAGEGWTIDPWRDGRTTLTATGPEAAALLAAGLAGLLAAICDDGGKASDVEPTTALPIRGEGGDVAALFLDLAASLFEEIDHDAYDVRAVRFDGMVRTDEGLAGWGYALAVSGGSRRAVSTVEDVVVTDDGGPVTLQAVVRRRATP
jgi:hypothetical protein